MYKTVSERFSRKVTFVSFILSIFVMYIHANKLVFSDAGAQFAPVMVLNKLSAETFGRIGVPFFFLQSGYWMFQFDIFEPKSQVLKRKLKKKVFTLGIPFLLWNTLGLLFFLVVTRLPVLSSMIHEGRVVPFTLRNVLGGIFLHQYNLVFWFMQDLNVLAALSPVWLRLLRNRLLTDIAIGGLLVLVMLGINSPIFQSSSLLLFLAGGALSTYHRAYWETISADSRFIGFHLILFLILAAVKWLEIPYLSTLAVIISPILFWKCCDWLGKTGIYDREPCWFCRQSFFIYAAHDFPVEAMSTLLLKVSHHWAWLAIGYAATPLIVLAGIYVCARLLSQKLPKVYRLLCGSRG